MKLRNLKKIDTFIGHHTLSGDVGIDIVKQWHVEKGYADVGYNFLIRFNGDVELGRPLEYIPAHALGRNARSIGVALTGDFRKYAPTKNQLDSYISLYRSMCIRLGRVLHIDWHRPNIMSLWEPTKAGWLKMIQPCPGPLLNRAWLEKRLRASTHSLL